MAKNQSRAIGTNPSKASDSSKTVFAKNHLLAVGISDYKFCRKLPNAVKDVQDFIEVLSSKYCFDIPNIHVHLMKKLQAKP